MIHFKVVSIDFDIPFSTEFQGPKVVGQYWSRVSRSTATSIMDSCLYMSVLCHGHYPVDLRSSMIFMYAEIVFRLNGC